MYYPTYRMRRLRRTPTLRRMMRETALSPDDLIYPLFVSHGENVKRPIPSMPGCEQLSIGNLLPEVREIQRLGIPAVLLFGIPSHKDSAASSAYDPEGVVQLAISARSRTRCPSSSWSPTSVCASTWTTAIAASCRTARS